MKKTKVIGKRLPPPPRRLEIKIEADVCKWAKDTLGIQNTKLNVLGQRRNPDRIFWLSGGRPLLIEFKRSKEPLTIAQKRKVKTLRLLGYWVEVADSLEKSKRILLKKARAVGHQKPIKETASSSASNAQWQDFY